MQHRPEALGARLLLVDNYSSFSQNLVHYMQAVTGVAPVVIRNDSDVCPDLSTIHGIVISPGPGTPEIDSDFGICRALLAQGAVPVLGICLGHQGLGVGEGAKLSLADEAFHGRLSKVEHEGAALFAGIPKTFSATRYHSLILRDPLPESLECIARTPTGDIMALRHRERPHWSVQFHPESVASEYGHELLANFCAIARVGRGNVPSARVREGARTPRRRANSKPWVASIRRVDLACEAETAFAALYKGSQTAFWLDGTAGESFSYMGDALGPHAYRLSYDVAEALVVFSEGRSGSVHCADIFGLLQEELDAVLPRGVPSELGFTGGFVGYFGYEAKGGLGARNLHVSPWPDAQWIWVDRFVCIDHATRVATLVSLRPADSDALVGEAWLEASEVALAQARPSELRPSWPRVELTWRDSQSDYADRIDSCREHIGRGESYELCLTTQLSGAAAVDAFELFRRMRESNPAPYAAFLRCEGFAIASASPERFLHISASGLAESKPIKGTAPRDADPKCDRENAEALAASEKERAENLMIVDLVRHDLSQVCEVGSVVVTANAAVESYSTVHQLVSTVQGQLRPDLSPLDCVAAAFPGGSMTGAPKKRSMEILDKLESGPRGPYSGCIGYLSLSGVVDLSIVIRSVVVEPESVHLGVGGAITALSESGAEVLEVSLKAKAQVQALGNA